MLISFYEEFPTDSNLNKLKLIKFQTKIYVAASSVKKFRFLEKKIKKLNKKVKEVIYWPILKEKEGYWFSPFAKREALKRAISEIEKEKNISIMWDAEYPINKSNITWSIPSFFSNKKLIENFFKNAPGNKIKIYTSEYYPERDLLASWLRFCKLSFSPRIYGNTMIKMVYTSEFKKKKKNMKDIIQYLFSKRFLHIVKGKMSDEAISSFIKEEAQFGVKRYEKHFAMAFGLTKNGVGDKEPIITPEELERDIKAAKSSNINEVIIYRLGGLNKDYLKRILKTFKYKT